MFGVEDRKLQTVYGFSEADIAANKRGELTANQIATLKRKRSTGNQIGIVVALVAIAMLIGGGYLIYLSTQDSSRSTPTIGMGLVGVGGVLLFLQVVSPRGEMKDLRQDLKEKRVEQASGQVLHASQAIPMGSSVQTFYFLRVGTFTSTRMPEAESAAFINQECYRVYYLPRSKHIVGAEKIDC